MSTTPPVTNALPQTIRLGDLMIQLPTPPTPPTLPNIVLPGVTPPTQPAPLNEIIRTGTGLDKIVDALLSDGGLSTKVSAADVQAGAAAASRLNKLIADAVAATGVGSDGLISAADVRAINVWIRSDAARLNTFVEAHGDDEAGVETGFHLVQNDGANTQFRGRNFVDKVADSLYHIGFGINGDKVVNEDGQANATLTSIADTLNYFLFNKSTVQGTNAAETLNGGPTNSGPFGDAANEHFLAMGGNDNVFAGVGDDTLDGGDGADTLAGGEGADSALGGAGNDLILGGAGNDTLEGGDGADVFVGEAGNDLIRGGAGNDAVYEGAGDDTLEGGEGADVLYDAEGANVFDGGAGADLLIAMTGPSTQTGGEGADVLVGGASSDMLDGGDQFDIILAGAGSDIVIGGKGNDYLVGGEGFDQFRFKSDIVAGDYDFIADFTFGQDTIAFDASAKDATTFGNYGGFAYILTQLDTGNYLVLTSGVTVEQVQASTLFI